MSKVWIVAWREFKQMVMRKIFILAVFGMPVLILGIGAVAVLMIAKNEQPPLIGTIAVAETSGEVAAAAEVEFSEARLRRDLEQQMEKMQDAVEVAAPGMTAPGMTPPGVAGRGEVRITIEPGTSTDQNVIEALKERVRSGDLLAAAVISPQAIEVHDSDADHRATYFLFVGEEMDSDHISLIERRLGQSVVRVRAARAGLDADEALALLERPVAETSRTLAGGEEAAATRGAREIRRMIPMVFMMLIWIGTFTSGQHLMMSTIEEKSNRVMEVLLSAASPFQLMAGKIIGYGAVGLLIVGIYSSVMIAGLVAFSMFSEYVNLIDLVYLAVFYFMAYFMVASLLAAVGSAVSDIREANTLMMPVMMILFIPLMLWMPIIEAPNGAVATAFSFIPPAIPFAMILRLAAEEPVPLWQIPVSIAWGYICVLGMVWMAGKIFRVGVLMYGKPPSPLELLKWVRYS